MMPFNGARLWYIKATLGLPLDWALTILAREGFVPSWVDLLRAAARDGANIPKLVRELQFYVREAYPADYAKEVNMRLGWFVP